jgi:hypothetical protein
MADKVFTLDIVILNHPAALPDAAEQPLVTGRNGHIAVSHRRVGGNALDLTARRAIGFCLLFARVQRLHTHTREIGK